MSHFATIDTNGFPTAFYSDDIYPPQVDGTLNAAIPSSAITISDADWHDCISNPGLRQIVNGKVQAYTPPPHTATADDIDAERDRRMYGGFIFSGVAYQTDATSISNILGAAQLAFMAIVAGAKTGDYSWAGGSTPFTWIAADNSQVQMDAPTTVAFAKAAAAFRSQMIYAARAAKNALAAGQTVNVTADATWGVDSSSPTSTAKVS